MPKKPEPLKKAAIYCRVSTYNQGQGDYSSLDTQKDLLEKYAQTKNWEIFNVYIDTKTGTTIDRPALTDLLEDARSQKFNIVLATKLDRISRSMKDFYEINELLVNNDIDLVLATQNIDTSSSMGRFNRNMLMAFAEFERDLIAERTREKLYSQAQKGFWGGGNVPLGYDVKDKKLVVNQKEAELVKRIFGYYLETPSSAKIATRLNREGYTAKERISPKGIKRGGGIFTKDTVKRMLRNKIYIGMITYKNEQFKGDHEPIVDELLFNKVQQKIDESAVDPKTTYEESPLTLLGIISCGHCGNQLTTSATTKAKTGKKYYYYKCSHAFHATKEQCPSRDLKAEEIELFMKKLVSHIAADDKFFQAVVKQMQENSSDDLTDMKNSRSSLAANLGRVKQELKTLSNRMAKDQRLMISDTLINDLGELETSKSNLEKEISKTDREIEQIEQQRISKSELQKVFKSYNEMYDRIPIPIKRRVNHLIFKDIKSYLKRNEDKGNLIITMRGDGDLAIDWQKLTEATDSSCNWSGWLRRQDSNLQPSG
jgi:site-specific DNA recombinase